MVNSICIIILGGFIGSFLKVSIDSLEKSGHMVESRVYGTNYKYRWRKLRLTSICTGVCFGIVYNQFGKSMEMIIGCTLVCFAIVLTVMDWKYMILPTLVIRWGTGIGIVEKLLQARLLENRRVLTQALSGAVIGYLLFMIVFYGSQWLLKKEGLGYGDVRFIGMIGVYVGVQRIFLSILLASLLASFYGIVLLKVKRKNEPYPLGPFLSIGGIITFLWADYLMASYLSLFNF